MGQTTEKNDKNILFTVVIAVKDRSLELQRALLSLQNQSYKKFDVVIVDDNSEENLKLVTEKFKSLKINLIKNLGNGANSARNIGIEASKGKYICFLDSDDIFLENKLDYVAKIIGEKEYDVVISSLLVWRNEKSIQKRPNRKPHENEAIDEYFFVSDERMQTTSFIIKRDLCIQVRWNEELAKIQDPDFIIRILSTKGVSFKFIEKPLAVLYDLYDPGRISSNNHSINMKEWLNNESNPLGNKAKKHFEATVLSYEIAKESKAEGLVNLTKDIMNIKFMLFLKTLVRMTVSEKIFKQIANINQMLLRNNKYETEYNYIKSLENKN